MPDLTPEQRIYLAAPYSRREEMAGYATELEALGYTITSRWHQTGKTPLPGIHTEELRRLAGRFAQEDAEDTEAADIFIAFTSTPMASEMPGAGATAEEQENGGTHVEFGIALALGKELWVVGPRENVFHCLSHVHKPYNWASALLRLEDLAGVRWAEKEREPQVGPTRLPRGTHTKGAKAHRDACQSKGHEECRAGPLWRCRECRREFCAEDGGDNGHPHLCDECWAAATQARQEE